MEDGERREQTRHRGEEPKRLRGENWLKVRLYDSEGGKIRAEEKKTTYEDGGEKVKQKG